MSTWKYLVEYDKLSREIGSEGTARELFSYARYIDQISSLWIYMGSIKNFAILCTTNSHGRNPRYPEHDRYWWGHFLTVRSRPRPLLPEFQSRGACGRRAPWTGPWRRQRRCPCQLWICGVATFFSTYWILHDTMGRHQKGERKRQLFNINSFCQHLTRVAILSKLWGKGN